MHTISFINMYTTDNFHNKTLVFFRTITRILLFLIGHYAIKIKNIRFIYYQTQQHWKSAIKNRIVEIYIRIRLVGRVFANGPEDLGSIPGRVIPKTLKIALDTSLLNTQHYKVRIKGKVEQSKERSSTLPYTSV